MLIASLWPRFKPQIRHQNENMKKYFCEEFLLAKLCPKLCVSNEISMKCFSNVCFISGTYTSLRYKINVYNINCVILILITFFISLKVLKNCHKRLWKRFHCNIFMSEWILPDNSNHSLWEDRQLNYAVKNLSLWEFLLIYYN